MLSTLRRLNEKLGSISLDDPLDQQRFDDLDEVRRCAHSACVACLHEELIRFGGLATAAIACTSARVHHIARSVRDPIARCRRRSSIRSLLALLPMRLRVLSGSDSCSLPHFGAFPRLCRCAPKCEWSMSGSVAGAARARGAEDPRRQRSEHQWERPSNNNNQLQSRPQ
jgi:hypothetical protein